MANSICILYYYTQSFYIVCELGQMTTINWEQNKLYVEKQMNFRVPLFGLIFRNIFPVKQLIDGHGHGHTSSLTGKYYL